MKVKLNFKCENCSYWNRFKAERVHLSAEFKEETKIQVFVAHYRPLKVEKCGACGAVIASEEELIRIVKGVGC